VEQAAVHDIRRRLMTFATAPEDQGTIFEEFRQVSGDYARKGEGTGLGLSLAGDSSSCTTAPSACRARSARDRSSRCPSR
jgi:hypothetical protein